MTDNNQSRTFVLVDSEKMFTHNGALNRYSLNMLKTVEGEGGTVTQDLITIDAEKAFKANLNRSMASIISDSNTSLATMSFVGASSADTVN